MTNNQQEINALDGHNGNHGDNMVENLQLLVNAFKEKSSQPPAEAIRYAGQQLYAQGRGGTSKYYAQGLANAANELGSHSQLDNNGVMTLLQSMMGAIPSEGHHPPSQDTSSAGQRQVRGSVLNQVLDGLIGTPPVQDSPQDDGLDLGDVVNALLPAGLSFLQAKRSGADTTAAAGQALMNALMGNQMNPLQAQTPRTAAGSLIAQSILQALTSRR